MDCVFAQRDNEAVKDCSGVAVAVPCGEGEATVRLTSGDLQAVTIERIVQVWRVSNFLTPQVLSVTVSSAAYCCMYLRP